ncbi:amidase [Streptomyces alboflavus]|uniref:Amidase n=1 Tax=Streptomyces alboflavus TaxID=67267 RepID=A0A1Z1WS50_9ACTN|nr:amidase [Streptomyces alboflavus]
MLSGDATPRLGGTLGSLGDAGKLARDLRGKRIGLWRLPSLGPRSTPS